MKTECSREQDVMEIVSSERWPDQCPDELRAHVAQCSNCTDVLEVAQALHEDRAIACMDAQIPSAELVWWRAELRARQEAMIVASRPITLVEAFGAAAGVGVAVALINRAWPWMKSFLVMPDFTILSSSQLALVIAFALGALIIAPLAVYLAFSDE